jgi:hypothetical protein
MAVEPIVRVKRDAAQHQSTSRHEAMNVVTVTDTEVHEKRNTAGIVTRLRL